MSLTNDVTTDVNAAARLKMKFVREAPYPFSPSLASYGEREISHQAKGNLENVALQREVEEAVDDALGPALAGLEQAVRLGAIPAVGRPVLGLG